MEIARAHRKAGARLPFLLGHVSAELNFLFVREAFEPGVDAPEMLVANLKRTFIGLPQKVRHSQLCIVHDQRSFASR